MSDTAIISAISPMVTSVLIALLYWGWRRFIKRLDESRDVTLAAVHEVRVAQESLNEKVVMHQEEDAALFNSHAQRLSRNEGALEVLTAIAAAKESTS